MPDLDYNLKPTAGRVAVSVETEDLESIQKRTGLILLRHPEAGVRPTFGQVVAVSPPYNLDGEDMQPLYPVGTHVIFGKYAGVEVELGKSKVAIIKELDILATFTPEGTELPEVKVSTRA